MSDFLPLMPTAIRPYRVKDGEGSVLLGFDVSPCIIGFRRFEGTYCLHLQRSMFHSSRSSIALRMKSLYLSIRQELFTQWCTSVPRDNGALSHTGLEITELAYRELSSLCSPIGCRIEIVCSWHIGLWWSNLHWLWLCEGNSSPNDNRLFLELLGTQILQVTCQQVWHVGW
jgi:hypothetical protein